MFAAYDGLSATAVEALAGKDLILSVWDKTGENLLAIKGQQGLTINRSADSIEITSKDTEGDWKSKMAGMKEWSIDTDGLYLTSDASHNTLSEAFENGDPVCVKVVNKKLKKGMFAGFAVITDYPIEAPHDDAATYSITLEGQGKLVDLSSSPLEEDTMPQGMPSLEYLTVVSVPGTDSGDTAVFVNPVLTGGHKYFYRTGKAPLTYPAYGEVISSTEWDGSSEISGLTAGQQILVIETDSAGKTVKAGAATISTKV